MSQLGPRDAAGLLVGHLDLEPTDNGVRPLRLPRSVRWQEPVGPTSWAASCTTGVRLRTRTAATRLTLTVRTTRMVEENTDPRDHPASFAALVDDAPAGRVDVHTGDVVWLDRTRQLRQGPGEPPAIRLEPGAAEEVRFELGPAPLGEERLVEVWFPHTAQVELLGAAADAPLHPVTEPVGRRWIHHGSSISHCLEADGPLDPWPHQAARELGLDLTSLALAASALIDQFTARAIRDRPAEVISLKLGINVVDSAGLRTRTFLPAVHGFLDTIRDGHPTTPIVLISAVACPIVENVPGPTARDAAGAVRAQHPDEATRLGELTLTRTRELLHQAAQQRAAEDPHLHYVDGLDLFGPADAHHLTDNLHPDPAGYDLIARRFSALVRERPALAAAFGRS
ncbi:lipase [Kitasatospora sp. NPDC005856]|uniref:GDSL-type esterase/lipase family protein n=1 Tax=Kitasatospora sp. NPDC005856 TaxID=3154566 RepID=UPI0033FC384A